MTRWVGISLSLLVLLLSSCYMDSDYYDLTNPGGDASKPFRLFTEKTCSPITLLKKKQEYSQKDFSTGKMYHRFGNLFEKGEEWGCLVLHWSQRKLRSNEQDSFSTIVKVLPSGDIISLDPRNGKVAPSIHLPSDGEFQNPFLRLYVFRSDIITSTKGIDVSKVQRAPADTLNSLSLEERKIRLALMSLQDMCRVADSVNYDCFGKNRRDCRFFFNLPLSTTSTQKSAFTSYSLATNALVAIPKQTCNVCAPEICNGLDDDCDGYVDNMRNPETGAPLWGVDKKPVALSQECYSGRIEELIGSSKKSCKTGTQSCQKGKWGPCEKEQGPIQEKCDGVDDDCDGLVDDDDNGSNPLCQPGFKCVAGKCLSGCPSSQNLCERPGKGAVCADLQRDASHCGQCNRPCKQASSGFVCQGGKCVCPSGKNSCLVHGEEICVDLLSDILNCGKCGNICIAPEQCKQGKCRTTCPPSQSLCFTTSRGICVDLRSHNSHCGKCNNRCPSGRICVDSQCVNSCPGSQIVCLVNQVPRCVDTNTETKHCGKCNMPCSSGTVCVNAKCVSSCPKGEKVCLVNQVPFCVDINKDTKHCGGCNKRCVSGQICNQGLCECPNGLKRCGFSCVDTSTDNNHCSRCDKPCPLILSCQKGRCSCPAGKTYCDYNCVDVNMNANHCGTCGFKCKTGQTCTSGRCRCPLGEVFCDNRCTDISRNPLHCGKCQNRCKAGLNCVQGKCQVGCPTDAPICGGACCPIKGSKCCSNNCVQIEKDSYNCGDCGKVCMGRQICTQGRCRCPLGESSCNGQCTDTQNNSKHCGRCNNACLSGYVCQRGQCQCPAGQILCKQFCIDVSKDPHHCGTCNHACQVGEYCSNGQCLPSCSAGSSPCGPGCCPNQPTFGCCNNACTPVTTSHSNCGKCGNVCKTTEVCCKGQCTDTKSDPLHCGTCGFACKAGQQCSDGHCCPSGFIWCGNRCVDVKNDEKNCGRCGRECTFKCKKGKCCGYAGLICY